MAVATSSRWRVAGGDRAPGGKERAARHRRLRRAHSCARRGDLGSAGRPARAGGRRSPGAGRPVRIAAGDRDVVLALFLAVSAAVSVARDRESGTLEVLFYGRVDEIAMSSASRRPARRLARRPAAPARLAGAALPDDRARADPLDPGEPGALLSCLLRRSSASASAFGGRRPGAQRRAAAGRRDCLLFGATLAYAHGAAGARLRSFEPGAGPARCARGARCRRPMGLAVRPSRTGGRGDDDRRLADRAWQAWSPRVRAPSS